MIVGPMTIRTLESLNLPAALEALERPVKLPPSLLKKAEEVRLEKGPSRVEQSIENVQKLAQRDLALLNEVGRTFTDICTNINTCMLRQWIY